VFEELNAQQKRIESSIPDRRYYESEEFQSLLGLIIEKLHTTHDEEKLRALGTRWQTAAAVNFNRTKKRTISERFVISAPTSCKR
jgi:hypothetical protein